MKHALGPRALASVPSSPALAHATVWASVVLVLLAVGGVLTSCDLASAGNTAILSANSAVPPTVRHRIEYGKPDATASGVVEGISTIESDDLDAILADNGFARGDVVAARVDSVLVEPVSAASLTAAALYLGTDESGPQIAEVEFSSGTPTAVVDRSRQSVTGALRAGASRVFARLRVDDPDNSPPGGGVVRAVVYFRIEVEGV